LNFSSTSDSLSKKIFVHFSVLSSSSNPRKFNTWRAKKCIYW
jgi:hypothetical protein